MNRQERRIDRLHRRAARKMQKALNDFAKIDRLRKVSTQTGPAGLANLGTTDQEVTPEVTRTNDMLNKVIIYRNSTGVSDKYQARRLLSVIFAHAADDGGFEKVSPKVAQAISDAGGSYSFASLIGVTAAKPAMTTYTLKLVNQAGNAAKITDALTAAGFADVSVD